MEATAKSCRHAEAVAARHSWGEAEEEKSWAEGEAAALRQFAGAGGEEAEGAALRVLAWEVGEVEVVVVLWVLC